MKSTRQEIDAPWKYILSKYFKSFLEVCWKKAFETTAIKMLQEKLPIDVIKKITGFSFEEIQALTRPLANSLYK